MKPMRPAAADLASAAALLVHWHNRDLEAVTSCLAEVDSVDRARDVLVAVMVIAETDPTPDMLRAIITKCLLTGRA